MARLCDTPPRFRLSRFIRGGAARAARALLMICLVPFFSGSARTFDILEVDESLPNIIVLVLDTVRASATSLSPGGAGNTPYLARLAQEGVVFENAYATFDSTPPSHFSIFTGLKKGFLTDVDRPEQSLAHHLTRMGYDAVGVSANYNVRYDSMRSVRPFKQFLSPVRRHLDQLPADVAASVRQTATALIDRYRAPRSPFNQSLSECSAVAVIAALDHVLAESRRPLLVFANFMDAHDPYFPPPDYYDPDAEPTPEGFSSDIRSRALPSWMKRPKEIRDEKQRRSFLKRLRNVNRRRWNLSDDLSREALSIYEERYLAEVAYLDSQVEKTMALFERRGLLENSLVIITSDHGESFGERGYITHSMGNRGDKETTRHVPLLMVPGFAGAERARRVRRTVSIADITPTIYEFVGVDDSLMAATHGDNYGQSLFQHIKGHYTGRARRSVDTAAGVAPLDAEKDRAALIESLKALGYITEE